LSALQKSVLLTPHCKAGKQAIKAEHRDLIIEKRGAQVTQSVDFEKAVEGVMQNHKRWDYFIEASCAPESIHAVEVHQYKVSELKEKQQGTVAILDAHSPGTSATIKSWHVLVKGSLPPRDQMARLKADSRIQLHRSLEIASLKST